MADKMYEDENIKKKDRKEAKGSEEERRKKKNMEKVKG